MIRHAGEADLPVILEIYARARKFMAENGNTVQWKNNRPSREQIEKDIEENLLYVYEHPARRKNLAGCFLML